MIPIARTENLLVQEIGNEILVYDIQNDSSHTLNPIATRVWHHCDGNTTIEEIANQLSNDLDMASSEDVDMRGLVYLILEDLERANLISRYATVPVSNISVTRRLLMKNTALLGGLAFGMMFPSIKSIIAPSPAMAQSINIDEPCRKFCLFSWDASVDPGSLEYENYCLKNCPTCKNPSAPGGGYCTK